MSYHLLPQPEMRSLWEAVSRDLTMHHLAESRLEDLPLDVLASVGMPGSIDEKIDDVRRISNLLFQFGDQDLQREDLLHIEEKLLQYSSLLRTAFGSLDNVAGKRILDLACGSRKAGQGGDYMGDRRFEPWMCRLVSSLDGYAIGIDIRGQIREPFEGHVADLTQEGCLAFLDDLSIDACHCSNFRRFRFALEQSSDISEGTNGDCHYFPPF